MGTFSYAELLTAVVPLAGSLHASGVQAGDLVGLCMPRGREAVAAMLAVLRVGAGYLPLDPGYPAARLTMMVEEAGPRVVLVPGDRADGFARSLPPGTSVLAVDAAAAAAAGPDTTVVPEDPAYVIFTSGSTGRPKGVVVPRRALTHFCRRPTNATSSLPPTVCCSSLRSASTPVWRRSSPRSWGVPRSSSGTTT
ncbi:AMP-binding protein [Streptomyces sp. NPDC004675]|uniref:AMP-binding protein n=1 Tax=Streptomyces sp. NPDC004675 TaxID=3154286 RepID=UPI0033B52393